MRASTVARDTARPRRRARWARSAPSRWRSPRAWPRRWNGPRPRRSSTSGGAPWPRGLPARHRRGAQGSGRPRLHGPAPRGDPGGGARHDRPARSTPSSLFPHALRAAGFPAAPEQTETFLTATGLLGPRSLADIRRAAHAVYGPGPERQAEFDAVFDRVFLGHRFAAPVPGEPRGDATQLRCGRLRGACPRRARRNPRAARRPTAERLFRREPDLRRRDRRPARLRPRAARARCPAAARAARPPARARSPTPAAPSATMIRRDGEVIAPSDEAPPHPPAPRARADRRLGQHEGRDRRRAPPRPCARAGRRARRGLHPRHPAHPRHARAEAPRAASRRSPLASGLVADWDGGTRLGEALAVFLSVPRFAAHARGALVIVVSDGLERGGPEALIAAMKRLHGLAWSVLWLSPLAADPAYRPETGAMKAILPLLDRLGDGADARRPSLRTRSCTSRRARGMRAIDCAFPRLAAGRPAWLMGPMQPRIFGPYEPIRRDYPMEEYLADRRGHRRRTCRLRAGQLADGQGRGRGRLARNAGLPHRLAARDRRLCRHDGGGRAPRARPADAVPAPARHPPAVPLAREHALPLRREAEHVPRPDGPAERRPPRRLPPRLRPAGLRGPDGRCRRPRRRLPEGDASCSSTPACSRT